VAFTYQDNLADVRSRVRFAVGDILSPGLLPDATYDGQIARLARTAQAFTATADDDTLAAAAHGYTDGDGVVVSWLTDTDPLVEGTVYYTRDAAADSLALSATHGGDAIDLTTDGSGLIAAVDEAAAIRAIAAGLAAKYAVKPSQVRLVSGLSVTWERVQHWTLIAQGLAGGAAAGRAKGVTIRRGPAIDYTTGEGDASE
jgi:hypothetical protein